MVTVKPDFNIGKPAYRLQNKHRGMMKMLMYIIMRASMHWPLLSAGSILLIEVFEYRLEHSSQPMLVEDRIKEAQIFSEVCIVRTVMYVYE